LWYAFDLDDIHQPDRETAIASDDAIDLDFACADDPDGFLCDICEAE
jgi:hypothetical protein